MLIISGRPHLRPGTMEGFLASSREAVALARQAPGCHDFVVAAGLLDPDRVNVYEEWESEEAMLAFRGDGPNKAMQSSIARAAVSRHLVASPGPA